MLADGSGSTGRSSLFVSFARRFIDRNRSLSNASVAYLVVAIGTFLGAEFEASLTFVAGTLDAVPRIIAVRVLWLLLLLLLLLRRRFSGGSRAVFPWWITRTSCTATVLASDTDLVVAKGGGTVMTGISDPLSYRFRHSFMLGFGSHHPISLSQLNVVSGTDGFGLVETEFLVVWILGQRVTGWKSQGLVR